MVPATGPETGGVHEGRGRIAEAGRDGGIAAR